MNKLEKNSVHHINTKVKQSINQYQHRSTNTKTTPVAAKLQYAVARMTCLPEIIRRPGIYSRDKQVLVLVSVQRCPSSYRSGLLGERGATPKRNATI